MDRIYYDTRAGGKKYLILFAPRRLRKSFHENRYRRARPCISPGLVRMKKIKMWKKNRIARVVVKQKSFCNRTRCELVKYLFSLFFFSYAYITYYPSRWNRCKLILGYVSTCQTRIAKNQREEYLKAECSVWIRFVCASNDNG